MKRKWTMIIDGWREGRLAERKITNLALPFAMLAAVSEEENIEDRCGHMCRAFDFEHTRHPLPKSCTMISVCREGCHIVRK
jgi:hypothetical protein